MFVPPFSWPPQHLHWPMGSGAGLVDELWEPVKTPAKGREGEWLRFWRKPLAPAAPPTAAS